MTPCARRDAKKFGQLLKTAVRRVALQENKNIAVVQDELGYALGRESGGASIQFWERGHIPAQKSDVETLQRVLQQQGGLVDDDVYRFAEYAGFAEITTYQANTFVAGPPISQPQYFFGRGYELRRLFNLWRHRQMPLQNAAIIGPRGSGKTSLLRYLATICTTSSARLRPGQRNDWLPKPEAYRWVYVDFRNPCLATQRGLLTYILTELDLSVPSPCTLGRFVEVVGQSLPASTIVLLDELDVALTRYHELDDRFWDGLRALACTQVAGKLAFVLAARTFPSQLAQRNNRSSDFFSIFAYTARLGPLTTAEAEELIAAAPIPFPQSDVDWILEQSQGWPLLLQVLCRERLLTLEEGAAGPGWREEGLSQLAPFQRLLTGKNGS